MRDYRIKTYHIDTRVEIIFDTCIDLPATDEIDARAKAELLAKSSIEFAFTHEPNLKALLLPKSYIGIKMDSSIKRCD